MEGVGVFGADESFGAGGDYSIDFPVDILKV